MRRFHRYLKLGFRPARSSSKKEKESKAPIDLFQTIVGVLISVATAFIAWQTYTLSERTQANNDGLKKIEDQLSETKFGFERMRDVYDRTEKYLSSADQGESRGRILVILINNIPEKEVRGELLSVVSEKAKLSSVAAKAADLKVGNINPKPVIPQGKGFFGKQAFSFSQDPYGLTTIEEFGFVDSEGTTWKVPKGFVSDGSSIPRVLWVSSGSSFKWKCRCRDRSARLLFDDLAPAKRIP